MEPIEVKIDKVPMILNLEDIECMANKCLKNSYNVVLKYPEVKIAEGIILVVDNESRGKIMAHAWNFLDDLHFDITAERIWITDEHMQVSKIRYALAKIHTFKDIESITLLEFDDHTKEVVDSLNKKINDSTTTCGLAQRRQ